MRPATMEEVAYAVRAEAGKRFDVVCSQDPEGAEVPIYGRPYSLGRAVLTTKSDASDRYGKPLDIRHEVTVAWPAQVCLDSYLGDPDAHLIFEVEWPDGKFRDGETLPAVLYAQLADQLAQSRSDSAA